jgi:ribokinase
VGYRPQPPRDVRGHGVGRQRKRSEAISYLSVVVLGGFVMDVAVRLPDALPRWGEAVQAQNLALVPGGKGLNQAIAASRLGARVSVIGAVGNDTFGKQIIETLEAHHISTDGLNVAAANTPVTLAFGNGHGDTSFVGWKNENEVKVDAALVRDRREIIRVADVLLMTLEVPASAVTEAATIASHNDVLKVLNPAPPLDPPDDLSDLPMRYLDFLIPNEWEARRLAGNRGVADRYTVKEVAEFLGSHGVNCVCVTRAHNGCGVYSDQRYREYPAYEVTAADTTGASDAFCAALGVYKRAGFELEDAIHFAQAAGAYVVRRFGAAANMPDRESLESHRKFLDNSRQG